MIVRIAASILDWYASRRRRVLETVARHAAEVQERALLKLVRAAGTSRFGREHDFASIRSVADYQARVPVRSATDDTLIPLAPGALVSHRRARWDALAMATERVGAARLLGGPTLSLDGSAESALGDPETGIEAIAERAAHQDLRLLSGMPSWMLVLFHRVAQARRPVSSLAEVWPNLDVVVHGGVPFAPYRELIAHAMGRPLSYVEVHPSVEGLIALQTERTGGLTLMLDYDRFYEFVPVEHVGAANPPRHTVESIQLHRPYAIALTNPAGLWSCLLGDTVRFVARDPLRIEITGRIRPFVNLSGESVIVEQIESALLEACRRGCAEVLDFTVAPRHPSRVEPRSGHDWLIEFAEPPRAPGVFARALDETLQRLSGEYRTRRAGDVAMLAPRVLEVPAGTFHGWVRERGKPGVPRVTNDREVADGVLAVVAARGREVIEEAPSLVTQLSRMRHGAATRVD